MPTNHSSDRRSFLTTLATSSAALAAGSAALAFAPAAALAEPTVPDSPDAWLGRIKGTHKQFFDAVTVNDGFALGFAMNFLNSNNETYKLPDGSLTAVVGMRHFSIPMGFTDAIWSKYKLGEFFKLMDPATHAPSTRNIYYHPHAGDLPMPGMAIDALMPRGVVFTVCNVALGIISGMTSKNAGVTPEVAKQEWVAGIIPGMVIVPAGVLAVNRAQEKGCTYCSAG